jgi:diadenosine tetraphosphate (Ap4A) HIT family hydrolase
MADHFTKLWASILDSSVWREPPGHRLVWIAMLLMKDRNGFVGASIDGLARRANVSEEETRAAIESFLAPDPRSRNQDNEGRRIVVVPRGWHILNHDYFTQLQDKEAMRAYEAARKADQRRRAKMSHNVQDTTGHERDTGDKPELHIHVQPTSTVQEGEPEREGKPSRPDDVPEDLWRDWLDYRKAKRAPVTQRVLDSTRRTATGAGMTMEQALNHWIANGQTGFYPTGFKASTRPAPGSKLGQPSVEHPRGMPIPFDSPLSPCYCPMCKAARERKGTATARTPGEAAAIGDNGDRRTGGKLGPSGVKP